MITEDELEYFVDYILIGADLSDGDDMSAKINQKLTADEMAEKVREVHE